ncbi:MAG: hypothetical protein KDA57_15965 [Planctomycetales bacterium]|nr:hypothetical protein [Planctomycetales bacterium]
MCEESEHEPYLVFTGRQRLDTAMHTLDGLVQGIVADGKVTDSEVASISAWLGRHLEFSNRHPFNEVIPRVQAIVADGRIDEEERADLLWLCEKFKTDNQFYDSVTADMQRLHGFLSGIIADSLITEDELSSLAAWIDDHPELRSCWPYDELDSIISMVMEDGKIDPQEHEALMQFFSEFTNSPQRKAVGSLDRESTVSGVCAMCPEISFDERYFCFTGSSDRSTRDGISEVVTALGGGFHKNLRNDTHYLVIGAKGNPCWAYACYGRKVEDAVQRRRNGQRILIVHEFDFWDAVEDGS